MAKYEWLASNSGPEGCPMELVSGNFHYPGGSLYIPPRTVYSGWGEEVSAHVVGDDTKPVPNRMDVTFFSYLENKFYRGTFVLPQQQIQEMFAAGYPSYEKRSGKSTYDTIVAGVAPGGAVAVWLSGVERQQEVFFGYAQEVELDWHKTTRMPGNVERNKFVADSIAEATGKDPSVERMQQRLPLGVWEAYRERYAWQPVFEGGMATPDRIKEINFFSGERDYIRLPVDEAARHTLRRVPKYIRFNIESLARSYELNFDEEETLSTFKRLGEGGMPVELVFTRKPREGKPNGVFTVLVRNRKESVELVKLKPEFYATR